MDYPTEDELFELQHQDELDALDEMDVLNEIEFDHNFTRNKVIGCKTSQNAHDEKENIPVPIPAKRKLSFPEDHSEARSSDYSSDLKIIEDSSQCSQSIIQEKSKETLSGVLDNSDDVNNYLSVPLSAKRKLPFSEDYPEAGCSNYSADQKIIEDSSQHSQSIVQEKSKRTLSDLSDNSDDVISLPAAKKPCRSVNEMLDNFLKTRVHSRASSSFFEEVRTFTKEQQMVTCKDGFRKYYSVNEEENPEASFKSFSQRTSSLLSTPIEVLKAQYFIMEEESELRRENEDRQQISSIDEDINVEKDVESSLWVEKYRPMSYMHLLSEEGINRTLLQWLKLWDKVVFGKEKKVKKKPTVEPKNKFHNPKFQNQKFQNSKFPNSKFQRNLGEIIDELDEHDRPYHKVAFLCGPPGLGKTTLAVIIARHAGYNVVELNASDDRSPDIFRTNLEAATQMKSVLHEDRRPNCLILDEIDGAPAPSINVLLSFIKSPGIPKGGKRKKGDIPLLMRPIICICNDQYSPALKPLRQIALVLNFPPTTTTRLSSRLNEISGKEGLIADMAALTLLCEKSSNDIRSCLSTLQFIRRMKNDLKVSDVDGLTIGQKDMQKTLFAVWQDVFYYVEKPSFNKIYQTISSFGDYDKVYIGIFENYANIKFKHRSANYVWDAADWLCFGDMIQQEIAHTQSYHQNKANLQHRSANYVWDAADWLCFGDMIQQEIAHTQSYFLVPYLPCPVVGFHLMFSSTSFPHISYPSAFYEHKSRSIQLTNTMLSVIKDMVSTLKSFLNTSMLLIDVFPFLLEIIKPTLRPVNTQLYSEREKIELKRVIELMLAFNLNYRQERMQDGTYTYVLDPNIEELIKFSGIKSGKILTYSAKQMIAREVEMEQMRKGEAAVDEKIASQQVKKAVKAPVLKNEPVVVKKTTVTEKPVLDFFGRKVVVDPNAKKKAKGDPRDLEVWYHFKEGYSNAVRRTVYIKDLM